MLLKVLAFLFKLSQNEFIIKQSNRSNNMKSKVLVATTANRQQVRTYATAAARLRKAMRGMDQRTKAAMRF